MEGSSPKRRRTSPRLSGGSSPTRHAPAEPAPTSSPRRSRPSFASPTRASMSRFNPEILERRLSQSPPKRPPVSRTSPLRQLPRRPSVAPDEQSSLSQRPASQANQSPDNAPGDEPDAGSGQNQQANVEPPPPRAKGTKPGLAAAPRRSLSRPTPRPLPPPAPEGEAELNPFLGNDLRRSPQTGITIPPPPEPELPPSVPDAVSSTPPRGIHSSSPSKWRGRNKPPSSSPLKRPPTRPGENDAENSPFFKNLKKPGLRRTQFGQGAAALKERSTNIRGIKPHDGNGVKKRKRDALAKELQALKRDLEFASRENDRIRVMLRSGREVSASDEDAVLDLLKRHLAPDAAESRPSQSELLAKAALDPLALVPLGKPVASVIPDSEEDEDDNDTVSHQPIVMTAAEELPFLELFSPFSISSQFTTLAQIGEEPLRQQFSVRLQSRQSPSLFSALVKITLDALKLEIVSIDVDSLEPTAKPELESFLRKICQGECNRSMERNIGIITWAMSEWLRISERRAQFWSKLQEETQSKAAILEVSRDVRAKAAKQTKGKGSAKSNEDDGLSYSTTDLLPFMGRQSFDIKVPSAGSAASIRLSWRVEFDWTGEAQSKVSAVVSIPGSWHGADRKGAFGKLPSLFQRLVEGGEEPNVAVRKVVTLLVGS